MIFCSLFFFLVTCVAGQNTLFNSCFVRTLAGIVDIEPPDEGAEGGFVDGPNTTAQFLNPEDAAFDPISGNIYVADFGNQRVRVLAPITNTVSSINHVFGLPNPFNDENWFDGPLALVVAPVRNIYVATNRSISQIVATGATPVVVAIPSLTNAFRLIEGMTFDGTTFTLYVSDILAQAVYSVNLQSTVPQPVLLAGIPSSPVANGQRNAFDGAAPNARFAGPAGIAFDPFNRLLFVADFTANAIRTVSITPPHTVTTIAGDITLSIQGINPTNVANRNFDGVGSAANFSAPGYVAIAGPGQVVVSDTQNFNARFVSLVGPTRTLTGNIGIGGSISAGYMDGVGTNVRFDSLAGMKPVWGNFPAGGGNFDLPPSNAFNTWVMADADNNNVRLMSCSTFPLPASVTPSPAPTVNPNASPSPPPAPGGGSAATGSSALPPLTLGLYIGVPIVTTLIGVALGVAVYFFFCKAAPTSGAASASGAAKGGAPPLPSAMAAAAAAGGEKVVPNPLANVTVISGGGDATPSSPSANYSDLPGTPTPGGPSTSASSIQDWKN